MLHLHSNPLRRTVHNMDLHHARHTRSGLSCIAARRRRSVLDLGPAVHVLPYRWASAGNVHGGRLAIGIRAAALQLTTVQARRVKRSHHDMFIYQDELTIYERTTGKKLATRKRCRRP
jgi:hypothetical protein